MRTLTLLIFILLPLCASAVPVDYDEIKKLTSELNAIYEAGKKISTTYDLRQINELRRCTGDMNKHRQQAKKLFQRTKEIGSIEYRATLYPAADAAMSCVYCGGDQRACNNMPAALDKTRKLLKRDSH